MPRTWSGMGGTFRELTQEQAMDAFSRGHSAPMVGDYTAAPSRLATVPMLEASLQNSQGQRVFMCGASKCGGPDVCGD